MFLDIQELLLFNRLNFNENSLTVLGDFNLFPNLFISLKFCGKFADTTPSGLEGDGV